MNTGYVNDSPPSFFFHLGNYSFSCVETRAKVQTDDFLPHLIWELLDFADVLHSGIVHEDVYRSEIFDGLFNDVFAVCRFGQISIDEFSFDSVLLNEFLD